MRNILFSAALVVLSIPPFSIACEDLDYCNLPEGSRIRVTPEGCRDE